MIYYQISPDFEEGYVDQLLYSDELINLAIENPFMSLVLMGSLSFWSLNLCQMSTELGYLRLWVRRIHNSGRPFLLVKQGEWVFKQTISVVGTDFLSKYVVAQALSALNLHYFFREQVLLKTFIHLISWDYVKIRTVHDATESHTFLRISMKMVETFIVSFHMDWLTSSHG